MNNWKEIYNQEERLHKFILEMLIKADGFDSPTGYFEVNDWIEYTNLHYQKISIKECDSIFEVGSGSGAFLYPLYLKGHNVGGIDFAESLITLANAIMPQNNFITADAIVLDTVKKYDIVLSHGVFLYFSDLEYAREVITKMIKKATSTIAILDINDESKKENYHKLRMKTMKKEEYEKKYKGFEHYFYKKSFFENIAEEHGLEIEIEDQDFKKYNNSKFRFNIIMRKKGVSNVQI